MDLEGVTNTPVPEKHFSLRWQQSHTNILRHLSLVVRRLGSGAAMPVIKSH